MELNSHQEEAVKLTEGSLLIQAGAGVGKTRVLAQKFFYLVNECGVDPASILSFSFTSKAAGELMSRVRDVAPMGEIPSVSTFHSFALYIVRKYGALQPDLGAFRVASQQKVQHMFETLSEGLVFGTSHFSVYQLMLYVATFKHNLVAVEQAKRSVKTDLEQAIVDLYERYEILKSSLGLIDFEDMLIYAIRILNDNPDVLAIYQNRYHYVFVDEYQDTNLAQNTLFLLLANKAKHRVVVGDFDQMIYAWRGANQYCMDQYQAHFSPVKVITLEQNYRSTFYILNAANSLISHNSKRVDRTLWTEKEGGYPVQLLCNLNELDELDSLVSHIKSLKQNDVYRNSDIAVLVRTHHHFEKVRKVLMAQGLLRSKTELTYASVPEISLLRAMFDYIEKPDDWTTMLDLIAFFDKDQMKVSVDTQDNAQELLLKHPNTQTFMASFRPLVDMMKGQSFSEFLDHVEPFFMGYSSKDYASFMTGVFADLRMNVSSVSASLLFLESRLNEPISVVDEIQLMTIHHSKGREFPVVFILGVEEGNIPHTYSSNVNLEEERRLLYVGMTRAKEKLFMYYSRQRHQFGMMQYMPLSSFLTQLAPGTFQVSFTEKSICSDDEGLVQLRNDYPSYQEFMPMIPHLTAEETCFTFKEGDTVIHKVLGEGRLEKITGSDDDLIYQIAFGKDVKTVKASYAPLYPKE